jgi:hypothetical protein
MLYYHLRTLYPKGELRGLALPDFADVILTVMVPAVPVARLAPPAIASPHTVGLDEWRRFVVRFGPMQKCFARVMLRRGTRFLPAHALGLRRVGQVRLRARARAIGAAGAVV